ncbi:MAG: uracil phosphoribosyltransferase [Acidimicrobiia bacterium]|nr:uracil phosphoribosyltransferase [Acidimicrobiia bacterium]
MPTLLVDHPLVAHRLATLRDSATDRPNFRAALDELASLLVYEACRSLPVDSATVTTPVGEAPAKRLSATPILVPVLRAGLGMLNGALRLLPEAEVGFVGLKRDELTLLPDSYVTTLPHELAGRTALVLDPMLATGGSALHTLRLLERCGAGRVSLCCVLAAPEGLAALDEADFDHVEVVTAAVDSHLNEVGFIVPGLGDAGDRQFGDY